MKGINSITIKAKAINELVKCMKEHDLKLEDIDRIVCVKYFSQSQCEMTTKMNVISKDHSYVGIDFPMEKEDEN